ncbi:MAG: hypothetical protein KAU21_07325, partial [Gammaproteobacteria bacterium]|nr:hypothetical protein [Gammaproteobacteria bacterium]
MIIANSSPLMGLSTPEMSNDGMVTEQMAGQIETPLANTEALDSSLQDGGFWMLLNEQLLDVSADETLQVIANKQLLGMPGEA